MEIERKTVLHITIQEEKAFSSIFEILSDLSQVDNCYLSDCADKAAHYLDEICEFIE